ncbi:TATA box-binding protein-associated factor RNA polymerase I subunit A [Oryzias latipes]|uniref:TATA box binding protein (TBP)-associated factor, RNA polymerase I, A n=1 Tax=Oryzias latipes TaxID=8090 RepID=H2M994_ORYLA|nr:TATA box-binding protein-associated factor RNA polymerase I subunit A [Oryzias latipes]
MDDLEKELNPREDMENDDDDADDSCDNSSRKEGSSFKLDLIQPICQKTLHENGFHQSVRLCLEYIREAMLHHRWLEAAEYMASYAQILEDRVNLTAQQYKELVWRISTEILHHHPKSTMDDYNVIYERMKHSGFKHYLKISLEHSFHLMLHGQIEAAKQKLSEAESWRHGKETTSQYQMTKLIQAYRSLLDYIIWNEKKSMLSGNDSFESDSQGMQNYYRQASINLKEILSNPGVWDPFILSYVTMLEFKEDQEEALEVLNKYAYDDSFPPNPNAHVFLYQYLKRHDASQKKLKRVLKTLHFLVPSHELMLEYFSLLLQSGSKKDHQKAVEVVLDMLDFACWRSNLDVWKCLQNSIQNLQTGEDWKSFIEEKMAVRKEWWPALHYTKFHAMKDSEENPELLKVKASLISVLCPDRTLKYSVELESCQE